MRSLPAALDAVLVEPRVVADEWQPLDEGLSDQEAIEGISVLGERQRSGRAGRPAGLVRHDLRNGDVTALDLELFAPKVAGSCKDMTL